MGLRLRLFDAESSGPAAWRCPVAGSSRSSTRDARPIRKGKLAKPAELGYVEQLAKVTPNTKRGARGFILPPVSAPGNPGENEPLWAEHQNVDRRQKLKGEAQEQLLPAYATTRLTPAFIRGK